MQKRINDIVETLENNIKISFETFVPAHETLAHEIAWALPDKNFINIIKHLKVPSKASSASRQARNDKIKAWTQIV
eukprot:6118898-Pleurochrysis_carterae.AAC.1